MEQVFIDMPIELQVEAIFLGLKIAVPIAVLMIIAGIVKLALRSTGGRFDD